MKKYLIVLAAALIIAELKAVTVFGQRAPESGPAATEESTTEKTIPLLLRGVDLTQEQKTQVEQILTSNRSTAQEVLNRLRPLQVDAASKILSTGTVEESQLSAQLEQILFLQNQLHRQSLKVTLEIRKLLTPQQLEQGARYREQLKSQQQK